jgi:hypothetical protein
VRVGEPLAVGLGCKMGRAVWSLNSFSNFETLKCPTVKKPLIFSIFSIYICPTCYLEFNNAI